MVQNRLCPPDQRSSLFGIVGLELESTSKWLRAAVIEHLRRHTRLDLLSLCSGHDQPQLQLQLREPCMRAAAASVAVCVQFGLASLWARLHRDHVGCELLDRNCTGASRKQIGKNSEWPCVGGDAEKYGRWGLRRRMRYDSLSPHRTTSFALPPSLSSIPIMSQTAIVTTDLPLKLIAKGKVRDVYDAGLTEGPHAGAILFVATDRISAFDIILQNVRLARFQHLAKTAPC